MRVVFRILEVLALTALVCGFLSLGYTQVSDGRL